MITINDVFCDSLYSKETSFSQTRKPLNLMDSNTNP